MLQSGCIIIAAYTAAFLLLRDRGNNNDRVDQFFPFETMPFVRSFVISSLEERNRRSENIGCFVSF